MSIEYVRSQDNLDNVFEESGETPVILYFTATWCQPCKMLSPVMESFAIKHEEKVNVVKIDVDEVPDLAQKYDVRGVPSLLVVDAGEVKVKIVGAKPLPGLEKEFADFL